MADEEKNHGSLQDFKKVCGKTHTEQAIWWLNGFWQSNEKAGNQEQVAETIWNLTHLFIEIQTGEAVRYGKRTKNKKQGCDLDEFQAHRVLEQYGETLTVKEMRARLLKLDVDNNKRLALTEYLINKYLPNDTNAVDLVANANQGGVDPKLLNAAENALVEAQNQVDSSIEASEKAAHSVKEAKAASKKAHEDADTAAERKIEAENKTKDMEAEKKKN